MFTFPQFQKPLCHLGITPSVGIFKALYAAYREPSRHYHTTQHISDCLSQFQAVRNQASFPDEIEIAIWFHDAVYDSKQSDNEEMSANWAKHFLETERADNKIVERVFDFILATKHPVTINGIDKDKALMIDIDLSIFGQELARFKKYDESIRKEYAWVPEEKYRLARASILKGFLDRDYIYSTDYFRRLYEKQAWKTWKTQSGN